MAVIDSEELISRLNAEGKKGWKAVSIKCLYENDTFEYYEIFFVRSE